MRVKSQSALMQRNWTKETGETVVISSVNLELTDGVDTFLGELTDQQALVVAQQPLSPDLIYGVQCRLQVRVSTNRETGEVRRFTTCRILNIAAV